MILALTGGFLGSGKTTATVHACQQLQRLGRRVAIITNDQGDQQVDSEFVKTLGITTREVGNGCFCCRYDELNGHLESLSIENQPDVIFAESVGSCTDLVATIVKPLSKFRPDIKSVVSVFVDAALFVSLIQGRSSFLEESVRYIYKKQMEESDLLIINKSDLLTNDERKMIENVLLTEYAGKIVMYQNSFIEADITRWLKAIEEYSMTTRKSLQVDYDIYGEGEAMLAWLDKRIVIDAPAGNGSYATRHIMREVFNQLKSSGITIGHLKFFLRSDRWTEKISFTTASVSADLKVKEEDIYKVDVLINARVQTDPSTIERLVNEILSETELKFNCSIVIDKEASFKPGYPSPTHRVS